MSREKILEVKNLTVKFQKKDILRSVSFSIYKGEVVSLIGLNGTGKSTLLKSILGLVKKSSGEITLFTDNIFYFPQKIDVDFTFPISVQDFCELYGEDGYQFYLEETGILHKLKSKISELSGGQFQRLLLAVALSRKPDILLLDEPTSGIDVAAEEKFYKLISTLKEKYKLSILLVSHDIHLVFKNSDQVLCLAGHLCCTGTPEEIKSNKNVQAVFGSHLTPYLHNHNHEHIH